MNIRAGQEVIMMLRIRTMRRGVTVLVVAGLLVVALPSRLHAQAAFTRVQGKLTDQNGEPLAKVPIYFESTDVKSRVGPVKTSKRGTYVFSTLDISIAKKWKLVPEKKGYKILKVTYEIIDSQRETRGQGENIVGSDQKLPELTFALIGDVGKNHVDIVMVKEADYLAAYQVEQRKRDGEAPDDVEKVAGAAKAENEAQKAGKISGSSRQALEQAQAHTNAGRHSEAIPIYRQYLAKKPRSLPPVYYYLGKSLFETGDDISAEQAFKRGLELSPDMKRANLFLGRIYLRQERFQEAIPALEKERDMSPESDEVYFYLGIAYVEMERDEEAIEAFEQAALLNPAESATFMQLAAIHERRAADAGDAVSRNEHMDAAEEMYQKVIGIDPRNAAISFYNLGAKAWNDNRSKEAAQAFRKAIEIDSSNAEAHRELARALIGIQDFDGAVRHFEEYLRLKPGAPDAREIQGNIALLKD